MADLPYRSGSFRQRWDFAAIQEETLQVRILQKRYGASPEQVVHARDNEAVAPRRIEDAAAIGKAAVRCRKLGKREGIAVEHPDRDDCLGDLLAVRAHILHRRPTQGSRNSGEA